MISEGYQKPDKSYLQKPPELQWKVDTLVQKVLPRQADVDKILKIIQRKALNGTEILVIVKEIQAGYLISPYFKDIYLHLGENKLPHATAVLKRWTS